jgi:hypothetical protein
MNLKLAAASYKRTSLEINEREESCLTIVLRWRRIGTEFNRINNYNIYREKETNNYLDTNRNIYDTFRRYVYLTGYWAVAILTFFTPIIMLILRSSHLGNDISSQLVSEPVEELDAGEKAKHRRLFRDFECTCKLNVNECFTFAFFLAIETFFCTNEVCTLRSKNLW